MTIRTGPRGDWRRTAAGLTGLTVVFALGFATGAMAQTDDDQFGKDLSRCRAAGEEMQTRLAGYYDSAIESNASADTVTSITDMQAAIDNDYMKTFGDADTPTAPMVVDMMVMNFDQLADTTDGCLKMVQDKLQAQIDSSQKVMSDADATIAAANATLAKYGSGSSSESSSGPQ